MSRGNRPNHECEQRRIHQTPRSVRYGTVGGRACGWSAVGATGRSGSDVVNGALSSLFLRTADGRASQARRRSQAHSQAAASRRRRQSCCQRRRCAHSQRARRALRAATPDPEPLSSRTISGLHDKPILSFALVWFWWCCGCGRAGAVLGTRREGGLARARHYVDTSRHSTLHLHRNLRLPPISPVSIQQVDSLSLI